MALIESHPIDLTALVEIHYHLGDTFYDKAHELYLQGDTSVAANYAIHALAHYRHCESIDDIHATEILILNKWQLADFDMPTELGRATKLAEEMLTNDRWKERTWLKDYRNSQIWQAMNEYFSETI